jgi:hypothetical protein
VEELEGLTTLGNELSTISGATLHGVSISERHDSISGAELISRAALLGQKLSNQNSAFDSGTPREGADSEFEFYMPDGSQAKIEISTIIFDDRIALQVTSKDLQPAHELRISGMDGKPLPPQFDVVANTIAIGSFGHTDTELVIQIECTADGVILFRRNFTVDLTTGRASSNDVTGNNLPGTNRNAPQRVLLPEELDSLAAALARKQHGTRSETRMSPP